MDLLARAAPFFILALIVELLVDKIRGRGLYRANDAMNSLSTGMIYLTSGYFTRVLHLLVAGFALQHLALIEIPLSWFDASPRGIGLWVIAALGWDFCFYWNHRMGHEISILWAAHSVHHQSEDYNLSTAQRQGSMSFLLNWIFYMPLYVAGFPVEVVVTVGAINLIYQFWVHTQLVSRLGVLDRIVVTPSNHRVHHAQNEIYIDKNYGGILILWDRLFGTFEEERDEEPVIFGVRKPLANWNPFWANLQVYDYLLFDTVRTVRWRDKLGIWFRRTGWRPVDVAAAYPKHSSNLASFRKFDPDVAPGMRRYILFQFVVAVASALMITQLFVLGGLRIVVIPCLLLWGQLYTIGLLNEGRSNAIAFETLRLLGLNLLGTLALQYNGIHVTAAGWVLAALYTLGSLSWLQFEKKRVETISNTISLM